jgi:hypothetical protein
VISEQVGDRVRQLVDLAGEGVDEDNDRLDALPIGGGEPGVVGAQVGEELAAADTEQVGHRHGHAGR